MATFRLSQINNSAGGSKHTLASSAPAAALNYSVQASQQVTESQNNGGLLGGVGYLFEKVGLGFLSGIEGIWDYGAGGIAKLFGADDWAEQQFSNDWVNYSHADEWFNPSEGWQVAGDVAGGIGTSLPAIAGVAAGAAIAYFSGGTLSPLAAGIISGSIAGFGAAGNATKEAYHETGNLGAKEFGYGFLSGATEAGVEFLSAGLAKGTGRIVSSIAKSTAKETAETVAKTGAKSVIKNLVSDFAQEAFEEGLSEVLSPVYQRMTFNPDAENATPQEVAYAALVGGLSGLVMSGGSTAINAGINTTQNLFSGSKAIENGTVESIMETARQLTETENANDTGYASFQTVKNAYEQLSESLKTTGGTVQTVKQKMLLGQIKRANTASIFMPFIERSAINILANAESVAQRYSEFGMKDANGNPLTLTADDIRSGVDATILQTAPQERTREQQKALVKSIRTALTSNSTLATLAVADATGRITMDTQRFAEAALNGANLANSADLNYFVEHASKEQIAALSADLGISDWSALTIDDFRAKVSEFTTSEKISEYAQQSKRIRAAMQTTQENAKPIPHILRRNMSDGVYRFTSENSTVNMAVFKEGETYHIFDYESGNISRSLSVQEVNKVLRTFWNSNTVQTPTVEQFTEETNLGRQALDIDDMATARIPEYHTLSEPNKQAVRMTIRQAQAHGITEAETLTFARVAARSGMNIVFDGAKSAVGDANIQGNTIYINPDAPKERLQSRLLLHEAGHALLRGKDGKNLITEAFKHIAPERSQEIAQRYINFYTKQGLSMEQYMPIVNEEITTAYIEDVLGDANAWEYILSEEPSMSQKILSFFRKAAQDYSGDTKLSAEARKLLRTYKKLFADLSAQNQGNNVLELTRQDERGKAPSAEVKAQRRALPDSIGAYSDEERKSIEAKKENVTARSYDDVLEFFEYSISDASNEGKTMFVGKISSKTAAKIHKATGLNTFNKSIALNSHDLRHMMKEHGDANTEAMRNQEAITADNFEYVIETIADPDEVTSEKDEKSGVLSLIFIKEIAGKTTAITIFSEKKKTLTLKTAWIIKKEQHISQPTNAEALIRTPEARSSMDTVPTNSISDSAENVNRNSENSSDERHALPETDSKSAETKVIHGYTLNKNADINEDLLEELRIYDPSAEVSADGRITVYHRTSKESADAIRQTGMMSAKEDAIFFSSKSEGYASDYGDAVLTFKIPSTRLRVNDIFDGEVHFDMPLKRSANGWSANVKSFLVDESSRFALPETDSDGKTISAEQRKYFSGTKVVDEQGRLLTVYHGSPKTFTEFSHRFINTHGNAHGRGFYFTEDMNYAEGYQKEGGQLLKGYLDIKKPASETKITMRKAEVVKLVKATCEAQAKELIAEESYGNMHDALLDTWVSNYVNTYDAYSMDSVYKQVAEIIFNNSDNDVDIFAELTNGGAGAESVLSLARKVIGYDGVIYDNGDGTHQFIAFESNQFKNADNATPTTSKDIRFALPNTDSEGNALSAGQREYFADSKVLDDGGNLLLVYHGTRKADFTEFRRNVNYFTDSMEMADSYSPNGEKYSGYLNITNPYIIDAGGEKWSRIPIDAETKQFLDEYGSSTFKEDGAWRTTPADIAAAIEEAVDEGEMDYDGIIIRNVDDTGSYSKTGENVAANDYIAFRSNQFKNADNTSPTADRDIRHALPDEDLDVLFGDDTDGSNSVQDATFDAEAVVARGMPRTAGKSSLTVGELRKMVANNTKQKVYSKKDALSVVGRFAGISDLTQKARTEIADAVWQILNESPDIEYRRDVAHDMAEFIVAKIVADAKTENPNVLEAQERLSYLRTGIGKLSFSEEDISEIRHVRDKKGLKQILGRWGYKGARKGAGGIVSSKRTPMDVFVVDIAREMPAMEYLEEMHPVDAFLEIDSLYESALAGSKDKWISAYWDMPDSEIHSMIKSVEDEIMRAYETEGEQSKFSRMVENAIGYYSERAEYWKAEYDKIKGRDRMLGLLMSKAQQMKDLKLGTFANSTQHDSEIFKNSIEQLARIQFRGNLNVSGTRKILSDLRQWYTSDAVKTGILEYVDANSTGLYVQGVADMLETLSEDKKGFTKDDLKMLYDVMSYFTNFVENWGKVFRQGKWIEAKPEAERYINTLHANESLKVGLFSKLAGTTYMQTFGDPMTVARRMDMYESGFYTEMMNELRDAAVDAQVAEMEMRSAYEEFTKKHKKYVENASVETVTYRGTEIPKMHLIGLYMTMKRKHAWAGLAANGFTFTDTNGKRVRVNGIVSPEVKITAAELEQLTKDQLSVIDALLTDADKEYIAILEQAYNVDARKLKADRDMQRLGFTNASSDYYYPIRRGNIAKNVDTADIAGELDRVSNSSFNKDTVRGAKQELFIESADAVFNRHIHAVCQYAYLSPAVEAYNRLYNLDISGNKNKPISVATESANTWDRGNKYFVKLISDIQGIPAASSESMKALGFIRGSYAKFQLGANPKVWLTQLSSIFASSSLLDADSITRGMAVSAKGMDEYCSLAKLRNNDNTAAMAQGVLDNGAKRAMNAVSKFSDLLMAPIGKMDRFVVGRLFGACQVQVEKNGGAKVGTEANKVEAGKLLRRVILETQQNAIATERSAAMRSGNEVMRTLTMFTADSMKVVGRVIDAIGEVSTLKSKLKVAVDAETRTALNQQLKAANRKVRKAVGALCLTAVFMASIAQLFRWLYDKEQDEDESVAETMLVDAVGNLFGGLPIFKDVYSKIFEGYDVDNYAYSAINDLLDSTMNLFDVAGNILTNKGSVQDRNRAIRNLAYSVGQMFGVPVRNVYNVFFGLTKRFNPETAYVIENAFYKKNYQNELYKAIEENDAEMTSFIMSLLLGERMNENVDEAVFNELLLLSKNGQKVIPRSVPSKITIDETEYLLSAAEQAAIKEIYATSEKSLKALFAKSKYTALSDAQKAEAIDFIYDTYYDKALEGALGIDRGNNSLIIADVVGMDNLALLYVTTKGLTSDTDGRGNVISGSKRKKVVTAINSLGISAEKKLLLICAKGYSLQDNDIRGLSAAKAKKYLLRYILSLKCKTKAEKAEIAELCGFEVVNGKIVTKTS